MTKEQTLPNSRNSLHKIIAVEEVPKQILNQQETFAESFGRPVCMELKWFYLTTVIKSKK